MVFSAHANADTCHTGKKGSTKHDQTLNQFTALLSVKQIVYCVGIYFLRQMLQFNTTVRHVFFQHATGPQSVPLNLKKNIAMTVYYHRTTTIFLHSTT